MSRQRLLLRAVPALLLAGLAFFSPHVAAQDETRPVLDPDLAGLAASPGAGDVDVWILLADQPARRIAEDLRPGYERLIDAVRAPALAALARIEPLLPPHDERARLGVGGVMEAERALLTDDEVATLRASRDETARLVAEMRTRILAAAQPLCDERQAPIVAWIEARRPGGVVVRTQVLDAIIARVAAADLPDLAAAFPSIGRIARAGVRSVGLSTSVPTIGASNWTSNGYTGGGGTKIAVVDTGIDSGHPALTTSSNAAVVTASTVTLQYGSTYDAGFNDNASSTDDLHGHGSHCAGIVASNDSTNTGVAPGTSLMNAKCFYRHSSGAGSAYDGDIVAGTDWALTNGATVLSCSFGGSGTSDGTDPLTIFYDAVVDVSGASVAMAAGNSGSSSGTINLPGDGFNVLTVGAFSDNGSTTLSDDSLASFSSRGPCSDGRRKPDLAAPGVSISSCSNTWEGTSNADFVTMSGTSMATPHVAGSMGLLLSYNSAWQPEVVKALLANTTRNSSPVTGAPDSNWGTGALDLGQAYTDRTRTASATFTSSGTTAHYYKVGSLAAGGRATIAWNRSASFFGGSRANGGGSAKSLVDLDLYVYDGSSGQQAASSASTIDSLEQAAPSSSLTTAVVKVLRAGSFPSGQTSQRYGLASASTPTAANPPSLAVSATTAPSDLAGSAQFTFTATVRNDGDLRAPSPSVTLTLPTGFSFVGSSATQTLSSLDPYSVAGATGTASWTVQTGSASGSFTLSVQAATTGYGDTFTGSATTRSVTVDATAPSANAGADISLYATSSAGRTVSLDGSASSDNSQAQGLTYAWDTDADGVFNDSPGSATGVGPAVAFSIGTRTVTLRVTDYVGNTGTDSVVVTVNDNPPVANAGIDRTANEGASVSFDGTGSSDVEGAIASYAWTFGDGGSATGATPSHTYRNNGTFTAEVTVTDSAGHAASDTMVVTVQNVAPTANAGTSRSGDEGGSISFSGSATDPGLDDVLAYSWAFGDGATANGAAPSHVYADEGTYTATLTVTDGDSGTGASTVQVTVANVAPTANAGTARSGNEGAAISFSGSASDPGVLDQLTLTWTFGDGGTATGASPSHVYANQGVYTATLKVEDGDGGVGTSTVQVTVANVAPTANAGSAVTGDEGSSFSLNGSATDPGVNDVLTYAWSFGDGGTGTGPSPSHVYVEDGVYTATLTVTDGDGGSGTSTMQVTVRNVAPAASAGADTSTDEGSEVAFAGTATDPGVRDVLVYAWNFGDGATAATASASHVYAQDGIYTATLTVTDDASSFSTSTRTITVRNVRPELTLPQGLQLSVGSDLSLHLAPTDPSPADAAALTTAWRVDDAAGAAIASGAGPDVAWNMDRRGDVTLVVTVTDDDESSEARATVHGVTPPLGAALPSALGQGLDAKTERKVLLDILGARSLAANPKKLKSAAKKLTAARALLAKAGVTTGPLVARLTALAGDLSAGTAPPAETAFVVPADLGALEDLIAAVPGAGLDAKRSGKLLAALVGLRYETRLAVTKKLTAARKKAAAAAASLPAGDVREWFVASLAAL